MKHGMTVRDEFGPLSHQQTLARQTNRETCWSLKNASDAWLTESVKETMLKVSLQIPCRRSVGYVRLIKLDDGWAPLDLHFGIPLFDAALNDQVCKRAVKARTFSSSEQLRKHTRDQRELATRLLSFVASYQSTRVRAETDDHAVPQPGANFIFQNGTVSSYDL